jgi:hypothetical protein
VITTNKELLDTIDSLICVIYALRDGRKEWGEYDATVDRAIKNTEEAEQKMWWQRLEK